MYTSPDDPNIIFMKLHIQGIQQIIRHFQSAIAIANARSPCVYSVPFSEFELKSNDFFEKGTFHSKIHTN